MIEKVDVLAVGLSPAIQKTVLFDDFNINEVNRSQSYYTDAAGKCVNVARVLTQASVSAHCLTVAGRGNILEFESLCDRDGISLSTVETSGRVRTCTTIVNQNNCECTELVVNEPELISADEERLFIERYEKILPSIQKVVVISRSSLSGFSIAVIPQLVRKAKEQGLVVVADYKGEDLINSFQSAEICPDYVKINEEEFFSTFGGKNLKIELINQNMAKGCSFIISRGSDSTIAVENGVILEIENSDVNTVNAIGCGDAMTAGFASAIVMGEGFENAILKGRDFAALNVQSIHPGWIIKS